MKFGLFDHVDANGRPLAQLLDERIQFVCAAEEAGFYSYHVAEHHATPLNLVPVPGIYLGAVARATSTIRLGPLGYLLPLYSPLRLIEEICILDHLSNGRFELGVGRGVSPFELNYHNVDHAESRDIFFDSYDCLKKALSADEFSYQGKYFNYDNVPMPLRPLQDPFPPVWYGSSSTTGSTWAGEHGLHFTSNGPTAKAKENIDAYRQAFAAHGKPAHPKPEFPGGLAVGTLRHIVVAETDEEALKIAAPSIEYHCRHLNWLRKRHGQTEFTNRLGIHREEDFGSWQRVGMAIAGSPETVAASAIEGKIADPRKYLN